MKTKFIRPEPIKLAEVRAIVDLGLGAAIELAKTDFRLHTGTWEAENEPKWQEKRRTVGGAREFWYFTDSTPMVWVDWGTEGPYDIFPRNVSLLRFQSGFIRKTTPHKVPSGPGARFGDFVFTGHVTHPGIEGSYISNTVADRMINDAPVQVQLAIDTAKSF